MHEMRKTKVNEIEIESAMPLKNNIKNVICFTVQMERGDNHEAQMHTVFCFIHDDDFQYIGLFYCKISAVNFYLKFERVWFVCVERVCVYVYVYNVIW